MKHLNLAAFTIFCLGLAFLVGCGGGGGGGGLFSPDKGFDASAYTFKAMNTTTTPSLANSDVRALLQASNTARLYAGTGNGLYFADPTKATFTFSQVAGLPAVAQAVNALLFAQNGALWVGTDSGLYTVNIMTGAVSAIASFTGEKIMSLAEQSAGVYWVGLAKTTASTTVVARSADGSNFTFFGRDQGMTASSVAMIYASENPSLVVVCGQGQSGSAGLFRYKTTGKFEQIDTAPLADGATLFNVVGSTYYAGGPGKGLLYQPNRDSEWKILLKDITPYSMDVAAYGSGYRTWVGSDKALYLTFDLTNFKAFQKSSGLASDTCNAVTQGAYGTFIGHAGVSGGVSIAQVVTQ